jgi:catechol 2,3-dioxygenase-like lactoylglutathione lyase family enzyme
MATRSNTFEMRGYNHIALVCSDMQKTVDFYEGILGFPLVKTLEFPGGGGQHFFFQVTEDDGIAFFYFPNAPAAAPGVATANWGATDASGNRVPTIAGKAAPGAMHHLSFEVPLEKLPEYRDNLRAAGVEVSEITRHAPQIDGDSDDLLQSLYFSDPDGVVLEFSSFTRALSEEDVAGAPVAARA